ncbi:4'-demethylrebeccamycin synthase-like [Oppia nitens]|uniref:4'-demethylrebeccamycin synthase-like n=1 Tax=Oppia nitens TaxID=1686743 RepID=UPI0023DA5FE2|nr:4'-demethylrebeccamycin synthase-like [Oppia nitens]
MPTKLTVLFAPAYGLSRLNASIALAEELIARGHRAVFAIDQAYRGQVVKRGIQELLHSLPEQVDRDAKDADDWHQYVANNAGALKGDSLEIAGGYCVQQFDRQLAECRALDEHYRSVVDIIRPDVIVVNSYVCAPALVGSGIPWVNLISCTPLLALNDQTLPPPFSGLPFKASIDDWHRYRHQFDDKFAGIQQTINEWYSAAGVGAQLADRQLVLQSPHLNIYVYPKVLDYYSGNTLLANNWLRVDSLVASTTGSQPFELPEKFRGKVGKLVLINMGRVGSGDLALMNKLVAHLTNSEHRFIVVTGSLTDKLVLPDNMWGQSYVSHVSVLPKVDLLITNGNNQSVSEAISYSKPVIVLPLFGEHFESGQRVKELALGLTLCPYTCSMTSLVASVDALVDDKYLHKRLSLIGKYMENSGENQKAVNLLESICNK